MAVILVVDDEIGISNLLKDVLSDEGYRVLVAANGREALKLAEEDRPDMVISDFMMPVMDGAELIAAIAGNDRLKDIPVVLISSISEATIGKQASGYARFVRKPFRIFDLSALVAEILAAKPPPGEAKD